MLRVLCFVLSLGSGAFAPRAQPIQVLIAVRGSQLLPGAVSPGSLDGALPPGSFTSIHVGMCGLLLGSPSAWLPECRPRGQDGSA